MSPVSCVKLKTIVLAWNFTESSHQVFNMVLHVKYAPVVTNCPFLWGSPISAEVLRLYEKSEQGGKFRGHGIWAWPRWWWRGWAPGHCDPCKVAGWVVVQVGGYATLLGCRNFWIQAHCDCEWSDGFTHKNLFTLEFLMLVPSYCAVYAALLSSFSSHQVPFFRPNSLLIKTLKHPGPWLLIHPTG